MAIAFAIDEETEALDRMKDDVTGSSSLWIDEGTEDE